MAVTNVLRRHIVATEDLLHCQQTAQEGPQAFHLRLWPLYMANQEQIMDRGQCQASERYKQYWLSRLNKKTATIIGVGIDPTMGWDQLIENATRCHGAVQKAIKAEPEECLMVREADCAVVEGVKPTMRQGQTQS